MTAIQEIQDVLNNWGVKMTLTNREPAQRQSMPITKAKWDKCRSPGLLPTATRVQFTAPRENIPSQAVRTQYLRELTEPSSKLVAARARSCTAPHDRVPATRLAQLTAHRTRSQTIQEALEVQPDQAAHKKYPRKLLEVWRTPVPSELEAMPFLDEESGQTLEFRQFFRHPKYRYIWSTSYANELGRLCQGVGSGNAGPKQQ